MNDRARYLHFIVRGLVDGHGMNEFVAVRRARDWTMRYGRDLPAADVALEIARNERRLRS